jgi:hypothetical protein
VRFNTEDFPQRARLTWQAGAVGAGGLLNIAGKEIQLSSVSAVWFRRPVLPRPSDAISNESARVFAQQECEAALQGAWSLLRCLWVSRPECIRQAGVKLYQLQLARGLGLEIPRTLVTVDPDVARAFCAAHRAVIAKPLSRGYVDAGPEHTAIIYTHLLQPADIASMDAVSLAPTLFQERIPKAFEIRVTVVGRRLFATAIHAPHARTNSVDWRRESLSDLQHQEHVLPDRLQLRILELVRVLQLQFAAIDFIVTPEGRYMFLEINPNGQWAWIEQAIGTPISYAITSLLAGEVDPL